MSEKEKVDAKKVVERLSKADTQTLVLLAKYTNQKRKHQINQVFITSIIATVTGSAIFASKFFPEISKFYVSLGAIIFGTLIVVVSFWQHKRKSSWIIGDALESSYNPNDSDLAAAEEYRKMLLDALEKEDE